jgi:hypothetical protein
LEVVAAENPVTSTSSWAIAASIIIAGLPHLWQFLSGKQSAKNDLTMTLLANLTEAHKQYSVSNESFRSMIDSVVERPLELAESNAQILRDLQGEIADLRGQMIQLIKKLDAVAAIVTRERQR